MDKLIEFLKDEDGQTSTEYILLLAVVAAIVFKFKETAMAKLTKIVDLVFGKAENMIEQ